MFKSVFKGMSLIFKDIISMYITINLLYKVIIGPIPIIPMIPYSMVLLALAICVSESFVPYKSLKYGSCFIKYAPRILFIYPIYLVATN